MRSVHSFQLLTLSLLGIITFTGCPKPSNTKTLPVVQESERPPLRILIPEDVVIGDAITRRWQSASDQRLDVVSYTTKTLSASELPEADIIIVESRWLATLAERGDIVPLPKAMTQSDSESSQEKSVSLGMNWPWAWKRAATYGQRIWGISLGVPLLVQVANGSPDAAAASQNQTLPDSQSKSDSDLEDSPWLIDRFLVVAVEFSPRPDDTSLLFQRNNCQSRLNESWLIHAASQLRDRLGPVDERTHEPPSVAWHRTLEGRATSGIGWPKSNGDQRSESDMLSIESPKRWVDSGDGLVAIITKKNRQSSTSIRFLKWLDEDEQRSAIGAADFRIQRLPENWQSRSDRPDVRRYDELLLRGLDDRLALSELQFAEAKPFRVRLDQALRKIVANPASAELEMNQCHQDWNQLTKEVGSETMKRRFALAYGLDKLKEK